MGLLLDYAFSTAPGPLQVSTAATASTGRVNISVSDPSDTIYCNQLLIAVRLGDEAEALASTANVPTASINTATWSLVSTEVGALSTAEPEAVWAKYTLKAVSNDPDDWKIDANNLVPSLLAIVNQAPGSFACAIQETSGTDPSKLQQNAGQFELEKVLPCFYAHNMLAVAPTSPTVAKSEFALGEAVLIEWESNGSWFELFEKGRATPIYAGTGKSFEVKSGMQTDTTFVLVATLTGNPGKDTPSSGYETVVLYDALTLTVSNPALTPTSVKASGEVSAGGDLNVKGNAAIAGGASVTGALSAGSLHANGALAGASLAVTTGATIAGSLAAAGSASLGATNVNGNLQASGSVNGASLSGGSLSVSGGANVGGEVKSSRLGSGYLALTTGNGNAVYAASSSNTYQIAGFYNRVGHTGKYITGVVSMVGGSGDFGFGTNGKYVTASGSSLLTHLETKGGHRVVTTPLVLEEEVQISGSSRLEGGRANVGLDRDAADLVVCGEQESYRVLVTPTGRCGGLAVVAKSADGFVVEALGEERQDVEFDWLLISRKRAALEAPHAATSLPESLPEVADPLAGDLHATD